MIQTQPDPTDSPSFGPKESMLVITFICGIWGTAIEVWTRKSFGARYLGTRAVFVLPLILIFACCFPRDSPVGLLIFMAGYLILCGLHRASAWRRQYRGDTTHSYFDGIPRLCRLLPRMSPLNVKRWVEPLVVVLIGLLISAFNAPLGLFLIIGAVAMRASLAECELRERQRLMDLNDSISEQRILSERLRQTRRND